MILTAHQPVYLPWLGLFHKIWLSNTFVYLNTSQFIIGDWMNRNKIKTHSGSEWLTVPIIKKGFLKKKSYEIKIDDSRNWRKKHFKSICLNYKNTNYFKTYIDIFEEIYLKKWEYISDLNEYMLKIFLKELNINVNFIKASDNEYVGKGSNLILDMCKKLKAKTFIFGSQGKNYVVENDFRKKNIQIFFQDYEHPQYNQLHGKFISNLSIIDLLFNIGPKSLETLIKNQNNFKIK